MLKIEKKWVAEADISPPQLSNKTTWIITIVLSILFYSTSSLGFYWNTVHLALLSILSARLFALDAQHRILPNIYILPLFFIGVYFAFEIGEIKDAFTGAGIGLAMAVVSTLLAMASGKGFGIGGGDLKLMIILGLFSGAWFFFPMLSAIFILALIGSFILHKKKEQGIPLGCYIILGLWSIITYKIFLICS